MRYQEINPISVELLDEMKTHISRLWKPYYEKIWRLCNYQELEFQKFSLIANILFKFEFYFKWFRTLGYVEARRK